MRPREDNMTRFAVRLFAVAAGVIFLLAPSVQAGEDPRQQWYDQWREIEQAGDYKQLFDTILHPKSREDFGYGLDFLRDRIVRDGVSVDGYFTAYSQMLWDAGVKETSGGMAGASLLLLMTDRVRCADNTAGQTQFIHTVDALKAPLKFYRVATDKELNAMFELAFLVEERAKNRPGNRRLCASGIKAMSETLRLMKERGIQGKEVKDKTRLGRTIELPDMPDVKIEFITDEEWQRKREDIRGQFVRFILGKPKNGKSPKGDAKAGQPVLNEQPKSDRP